MYSSLPGQNLSTTSAHRMEVSPVGQLSIGKILLPLEIKQIKSLFCRKSVSVPLVNSKVLLSLALLLYLSICP